MSMTSSRELQRGHVRRAAAQHVHDLVPERLRQPQALLQRDAARARGRSIDAVADVLGQLAGAPLVASYKKPEVERLRRARPDPLRCRRRAAPVDAQVWCEFPRALDII